MTEEFALPCQFLALLLFYRTQSRNTSIREYAGIGMMAGALFFLRPNLIGIPVSIALYLLISKGLSRQWGPLVKNLSAMFLGSLSIFLAVIGYFAANHQLPALWDCMFRYNFVYVGLENHSGMLNSLQYGAGWLDVLSGVSAVAWIAAIIFCWRNRKQNSAGKPLICLALVALPIDLCLSALSGRSYRHYYITWLPVMGVLAGFYASTCLDTVKSLKARFHSGPARALVHGIWITLFLITPLPFLGHQVVRAYHKAIALHAQTIDQQQAADYVEQVTHKTDYILVWGAETSIHFVSGRPSPTRFVYQYPLYTPGYQTAAMIEEFLKDLIDKKPEIIVDTSSTEPTIPPINAQLGNWSYKWYRALPEMQKVYEFVISNYRLVGEIGQEGWLVYKYRGRDG